MPCVPQFPELPTSVQATAVLECSLAAPQPVVFLENIPSWGSRIAGHIPRAGSERILRATKFCTIYKPDSPLALSLLLMLCSGLPFLSGKLLALVTHVSPANALLYSVDSRKELGPHIPGWPRILR